MIRNIFLMGIVFFFFIPASIMALMPPEDMIKRNLEAQHIVIGEVVEKGETSFKKEEAVKNEKHSPDRFFVVRVSHIVKGDLTIKPKDRIRILCDRPLKTSKELPKFDAKIVGIRLIKVDIGSVVILYIDPLLDHPGYYRPLAAGASVITIGRP